jgi:hypothetical protein
VNRNGIFVWSAGRRVDGRIYRIETGLSRINYGKLGKTQKIEKNWKNKKRNITGEPILAMALETVGV